jgi:hypothetical protein
MVYALTNPVKDGLVERTVQWPGLDCLTAIAEGTAIVAARPRCFFRPDTALPEHETLTFVRPPGFEHLSHDAWVEQVRVNACGSVVETPPFQPGLRSSLACGLRLEFGRVTRCCLSRRAPSATSPGTTRACTRRQ